jgi:hypothetical protein
MPRLSELLPEAAEPGGPADDLDAWLDAEDVPDGAPFLISPALEYDIDLNRYFLRPAIIGAAQNTRLASVAGPGSQPRPREVPGSRLLARLLR